MIQAEFAVINQTVAAVEDDVLTLSLAGGFESRHPINFTIVMPAASQLRYVANYGSGTVVLGPGECVLYIWMLLLKFRCCMRRVCACLQVLYRCTWLFCWVQGWLPRFAGRRL
jgi:hypothetical protein